MKIKKKDNTIIKKIPILAFFFTFPYLFYKGLWICGILYLVLFYTAMVFTLYLEIYYLLAIWIVLKIITVILLPIIIKIKKDRIQNSNLDESIKNKKINLLKNGLKPLFGTGLIIFIGIWLLFSLSNTNRYIPETKIYPENFSSGLDNVVFLEGSGSGYLKGSDIDFTLVVNQTKTIYSNFENNFKPSKSTQVIWSSTDPDIVDVSACVGNKCKIKPLKTGKVHISLEIVDKRYLLKTRDIVTFQIIATDTIHYYQSFDSFGFLANPVYSDKDSELKYSEDSKYINIYDYLCRSNPCNTVVGSENAIIVDGNDFYLLNFANARLDKKEYNPTPLTETDKLKELLKNSSIKQLIDPYNEYFNLFMGNDKGYTGIYSLKSKKFYPINYSSYYSYYPLYVLRDSTKSHVYNIFTEEYKTYDFEITGIYCTFTDVKNNYCLFSDNGINHNHNVRIFVDDDNNYYPILDEKLFHYVSIGSDGTIYSYDLIDNKKVITAYDLTTGNQKDINTIPEGFEFIDYMFETYAVGVLDGKVTILNVSDGTIYDQSISIPNDEFKASIVYENHFSDFNVELDFQCNEAFENDEIILTLYKNEKESYYYHYRIYSYAPPAKIEVKQIYQK